MRINGAHWENGFLKQCSSCGNALPESVKYVFPHCPFCGKYMMNWTKCCSEVCIPDVFDESDILPIMDVVSYYNKKLEEAQGDSEKVNELYNEAVRKFWPFIFNEQIYAIGDKDVGRNPEAGKMNGGLIQFVIDIDRWPDWRNAYPFNKYVRANEQAVLKKIRL